VILLFIACRIALSMYSYLGQTSDTTFWFFFNTNQLY